MGNHGLMLKLDPAHTMLWRSTTSVQFGADRPVVILPDVGTTEEHLIAVLGAGVSEVSLTAIATHLGMTQSQLGAFLRTIGPALVANPLDRSWRISLDGVGLSASWLQELLTDSGHEIVATSPDVALILGHHVLQPDRCGSWLRRDIAHLPILFGDAHVRLGPLITPGEGPCLHCVNRHYAQADDTWAIAASQLLGRPSQLEKTQLCLEVATMVTRWINNAAGPHSLTGWVDRLDPTRGLHRGEVVTIEAATGHRSRATYSHQQECACQALPQNVTPIGRPHDGNPARPTTATVGASPA